MEKIISAVPLGDDIFVTAKKTETTASGIILTAGNEILTRQVVLAKGRFVEEIEVGDEIEIDLTKFIEKVSKTSKLGRPDKADGVFDEVIGYTETIKIPVYTIDGQDVIKLKHYEVLWKYPKDTTLEDRGRITLLKNN